MTREKIDLDVIKCLKELYDNIRNDWIYSHIVRACTSVSHKIHTKYKNNNIILWQFIVVQVGLRPLLSSTTEANT